ncbi:PepSY domain-containing protein [Sporosarcina luteola]|uniref:PepSY domain-containing protein n=1 Tax=Sporosarcina luteola TaxID=582850 RepID=UPI00203A840E|nr:PepSY domain-containing protein [Sporosarcina luteola]MCM3744597.1 PepSY domain-containing protein [Sporosarcina luteola]
MKVKLLLIGFIILGLLFSLFQIFSDSSAEFTEQEAQDIAIKLYGGKVLDYAKQNGDYEITLENDRGVYFLVVDGKNKKVNTIKLLEKKDELDSAGGKVVSDTIDIPGIKDPVDGRININEEKLEAIYEKKAIEIALKQAHGIITNVEKVTTQKGDHYKVTIDSVKEVAHVYVQSDTGKVSSVSSIPKKQRYDDDDHDDETEGITDDD